MSQWIPRNSYQSKGTQLYPHTVSHHIESPLSPLVPVYPKISSSVITKQSPSYDRAPSYTRVNSSFRQPSVPIKVVPVSTKPTVSSRTGSFSNSRPTVTARGTSVTQYTVPPSTQIASPPDTEYYKSLIRGILLDVLQEDEIRDLVSAAARRGSCCCQVNMGCARNRVHESCGAHRDVCEPVVENKHSRVCSRGSYTRCSGYHNRRVSASHHGRSPSGNRKSSNSCREQRNANAEGCMQQNINSERISTRHRTRSRTKVSDLIESTLQKVQAVTRITTNESRESDGVTNVKIAFDTLPSLPVVKERKRKRVRKQSSSMEISSLDNSTSDTSNTSHISESQMASQPASGVRIPPLSLQKVSTKSAWLSGENTQGDTYA